MFKESFCSSPWFHLRINYNGDFIPCRCQQKAESDHNIRNTTVMQFYNSDQMKELRTQLLDGISPIKCSECYFQDSQNKLSGRIRQLNKSGIIYDHFDLSLLSSPHYEHFKHSAENAGASTYFPVDLQIDLGNICNSACIMCNPMSSSRLTTDYKKLNKINKVLFARPDDYVTWTRDESLVDKVVSELVAIPNIRYIHFLGGETLYDPAFYTLCEKLIEAGMSKDIIVGTTTNGTIYDERVERLIPQFKEFHLGISIESVTPLNDYIRYPSEIDSVLLNIDKFLELRNKSNLYLSLRITPNLFTVSELPQLFQFMIDHRVIAESCNILNRPEQLRIELLPEDIRNETVEQLRILIEKNKLEKSNSVNVRRPDLIDNVIGDRAIEYKTFLENYSIPENVEELRYQLVDFLKAFESLRDNTILDYAPRYEEFLRRYGY